MRNLFEQFRHSAEQHADAAAIDEFTAITTYGQLIHQVDHVCRLLLEDVGDGQEPIAILAGHGGATIRALLGVWAAGKAAVPLDAGLPTDTLRERWSHSACRTIVCDRENRELAEQIGGRELVMTVPVERGCGERHTPEDCRTSSSLSATSNVAVIVYTSGSTGRPRGVVHTHDSLSANARAHIRNLQLSPSDRGLLLAQASTISGLTDSLRMLLAGGTLVPYDLTTAGLSGLIERLNSSRPTIAHFVPTIFRRVIAQLDEPQRARPFRSLRILHLGGESVTRQDFELFHRYCPNDCRLLHNLGCTEAPSFRQSLFYKTSKIEGQVLSLEHDVPDKTVHLIDMTTGRTVVDPGHDGEIVVRSRYTAVGYWRDEQLTATAFKRLSNGDVDYRTGDIGCWTSSRALVHLGRKDQQVKVLGRRIDLARLEAELAQHPQIDEAAVLAIPTQHSTRLVACYVSTSGLRGDQLRAMKFQSCDSLPILEFVALPEFPTLPNGKIDRLRLKQLAENQSGARTVERQVQLTMTEERLAGIWRDVLKLDHVSPDEDFFSVGGDSLLAVELLVRIADTFQNRLDLSQLIAHPTVRQLAEDLDTHGRSQPRRRCLSVIRNGPDPILAVGGFDAATPLCKHFDASSRSGQSAFDHQLGTSPCALVSIDPGLAVLTRPGARDLTFRYPTIERCVELYCSEIAKSGISSASAIVGFSYGGLLAYALACRLWQTGMRPRIVMLIEPTAPYRNRFTEIGATPRLIGPRLGEGTHDSWSESGTQAPELDPIAVPGAAAAAADGSHPIDVWRRLKHQLARWSRREDWIDSARYARLLMKSLLARPLNTREEWDLFRPVLRRNLQAYVAPSYPGEVLLVGSASYLSASTETWQRMVTTDLQTVTLGQEADHFAFARPQYQEIWTSALIERLATGRIN